MKQSILIIFILFVTKLYAQKEEKQLKKFPHLTSISKAFSNPLKDSAIYLQFDYKKKYQKLPRNFWSHCRHDSVLVQAEIDTLFALGKIVTHDYTLYLIKYDGGNLIMWNSIYMYMFHAKKCTEIRLDFFWGAEGGEGYSKSWVLDYNADDKADLLLENKDEIQSYNENFDTITKTDYHLLIWNKDKWVEQKIDNIEKLKKKFKIK